MSDERGFVIEGDDEDYRIFIHPWIRNRPEVFVSVGDMKRDGEPRLQYEDDNYYECAIVDRAEFVEGLLSVFPELMRREEKP